MRTCGQIGSTTPNSQQFTLRDDIIQFSHDITLNLRGKHRSKNSGLNHSNINWTAEQPISKTMHKRFQQGNFHTFRVWRKGGNSDPQPKMESGKYQTKQNSHSFTSSASNRYQRRSSLKIEKAQSMQITSFQKATTLSARKQAVSQSPFDAQNFMNKNQEPKKQEKDQSRSCSNIEKKYNKSEATDASVQSWLNEALIEASPSLGIDKNQQNSGLKQYSIDRSSLLRIGINPLNVGRLYRSFFVYSLGFNNLLKDICSHNKQLSNAVWRVFAVLLEYCSGGNFQTIIGELERDKQSKLSEMRIEIEKRQKMIQEKDEISEKKNARIMKEVRELQEKTKELRSENQVILQDFHQAQQAFNEEIALRLKYETKINEIHGSYEELRHKHSELREGLQAKLLELSILTEANDHLRKQLSERTGQLQVAKIKIMQLESEKLTYHGNLSSLQKISEEAAIKSISTKHSSQSLLHQLKQKCRKVEQLELSVENLKASEKSLLLMGKMKAEQLENAMKENEELRNSNLKNLVIIDQTIQQNRALRHKSGQFQVWQASEKRKLNEKDKIIALAKQKIEQAQQKLRICQIQLAASQDRNASLEKDLQSCHQNIRQMKTRQNQLSTIVEECNTKMSLLSETVRSKQVESEKYQTQIEELKQKIQEQRTELRQKDSKMSILEETTRAQKQMAQAKFAKLEQEFSLIKQKHAACQQQREALLGEIDSGKEKFEKLYTDLKNEKFERNNLGLYYQQSLSVMEQEIQHIKRLNIKISEMEEVVEEWKRKYHGLDLIHRHQTQSLKKEADFWRANFGNAEAELKERKSYIHPMLFEDVSENLRRLLEKVGVQNQMLAKSETKLKEMQTRQRVDSEKSNRIIPVKKQDLSGRVSKQLQKKEEQIRFLREKVSYQTSKIADCEQINTRSKAQKNAVEESLRKVESQLMQKVGLKNKELNDLNEKYRMALRLNQFQAQQIERARVRSEDEKKQLLHRIEALSHEVSSSRLELRNSIQKEKASIKRQSQQNQGIKTRGHEDRNQNQGQKLNHEEGGGWKHEEPQSEQLFEDELFQLQSKEHIIGKDATAGTQALTEVPKKREDIRKKIKGAYLYYCQ